jgi:hypothetical protein
VVEEAITIEMIGSLISTGGDGSFLVLSLLASEPCGWPQDAAARMTAHAKSKEAIRLRFMLSEAVHFFIVISTRRFF